MAQTIRIDGLADLEKTLREIGPQLQGTKGITKNPLRNAARAMAKVVKDAAIAKAPMSSTGSKDAEGNLIPPGRLKRAIVAQLLSTRYRDRHTARGDSKEYYYVGYKTGNSREDPKGAYYGTMVELGTDKMPAQPFLRPALEENKSKLPGVFADKLGRDLNRIVKKLAKHHK